MQPLEFSADLNQLQPIRDYVKQACADAGIDARGTYNLQLAVDEIATNIVTHGYEEAGLTGQLRLRAETDEDNLRIVLEDTGKEFDPTTRLIDEGDLTKPLEERAMGGLGIYLALQGIDGFSYKRDEGVNRNTFIMKRKKA